MSRGRTRARNRRAPKEAESDPKELTRLSFCAEAEGLLNWLQNALCREDRLEANDRLGRLVQRIADSDVPVWPFLPLLCDATSSGPLASEDRDEVKALIAQAVAARLAGMTPGSVKRQHRLGESNGLTAPVSGLQSQV